MEAQRRSHQSRGQLVMPFCLTISVSLYLCGWICCKTKPATDPWKDRWPVSGNLS